MDMSQERQEAIDRARALIEEAGFITVMPRPETDENRLFGEWQTLNHNLLAMHSLIKRGTVLRGKDKSDIRAVKSWINREVFDALIERAPEQRQNDAA